MPALADRIAAGINETTAAKKDAGMEIKKISIHLCDINCMRLTDESKTLLGKDLYDS